MPKVTEPTIEVTVHDIDNPITVELAKELLGWEGAEKGKALLRDLEGNQITCKNNLDNRPLYKSNYDKLKQEILRGFWRLNGEPIIIGETGKVLNGQHSLIALVLSSQEVAQNPELWEDVWDGEEPYIQKVIVHGVSEDDEVVNTMDTCKPRSLSDVIYRSEFFQDLSGPDRKKSSKTAEFAVRLLWDRTGAKLEAYCSSRTHSEFLNLIERHGKVLEAVRLVQDREEGTKSKLSRFLSLGRISGLLYLMASSTSSSEYFQSSESRTEDNLNFDLWDEAVQFWEGLIDSPDFDPVRKSLSKLIVDGDSTANSKQAVIIKAWECFIADKKITATKLKLKYEDNDNGVPILCETPTVGGIDLGAPTELPGESDTTDDEEEEIEERKEKVKKASVKKKTDEDKPIKPRRSKKGYDVGDTVWAICEEEDSHWKGEITDIYGAGSSKVVKLKVANGFSGAGNEYEHPYTKIQTEKP